MILTLLYKYVNLSTKLALYNKYNLFILNVIGLSMYSNNLNVIGLSMYSNN
jgi:hypothetical protein